MKIKNKIILINLFINIYFFKLSSFSISQWIPFKDKKIEWTNYNPFKYKWIKSIQSLINNNKMNIGLFIGFSAILIYLIKYVLNKKSKPLKKDLSTESTIKPMQVPPQTKQNNTENNKFSFRRVPIKDFGKMEKYKDRIFSEFFQNDNLFKKTKEELKDSIFASVLNNYNYQSKKLMTLSISNNSIEEMNINQSAELNLEISQSISDTKINMNETIDLSIMPKQIGESNMTIPEKVVHNKAFGLFKRYYEKHNKVFMYFEDPESCTTEIAKELLLYFIGKEEHDKYQNNKLLLNIFKQMVLEYQNNYHKILEYYSYLTIKNNDCYKHYEINNILDTIEIFNYIYTANQAQNNINSKNKLKIITQNKNIKISNDTLKKIRNFDIFNKSPILQNIINKENYLPPSLSQNS